MKKLWIALILLIIIIIPVSWFLISPLFTVVEVNEPAPVAQQVQQQTTQETMEEEMKKVENMIVQKNEAMPQEQSMMKEGTFQAHAHSVKGKALLLDVSGKQVLRFENFETDNGPDLKIYLSTDLTNNDFVDLGKIKATKGNVNYDIPAGTDTSKYNKVLIWCRAFGVLFSSATLV